MEILKSLPGEIVDDSTPLKTLPSNVKILGVKSPTRNFVSELPTQTGPTTDEILANVKTNNDSEKQTLKSLAAAVNEGRAKHEDLVDAIQTFEGTHKNQEGGGRYYMTEENGVYKPVPLSKTEQPPKNKNVSKIFEDSSVFEDLGNSIKAGAEKLGSMIVKTPGFLFDLPGNALGVEAKLPSDQLSDDIGVVQENTWATHFDEKAKLAKQQIEQKYDKGITDYISAGEYSKAVGALGNAVAESLPVTVSLMAGNVAGLTGTGATLLGGAVFGAGKKSELDQENTDLSTDKKNAISVGYGLAEGFFEQFGLTKLGSITAQVLKKEGKDAAKVFAENAFKEVYSKPLVNLVGTLGEESASEAATQFAQNAIDKYSGYKPDKDLSEGVIDAALVGLGAGTVIGGAAKGLEKKVDGKLQKENEQSQYAYEVSKKGTDAVNAFKADIDNSVKSGDISPEKAEAAKLKVEAFKEYHDQTNDLPIDDKAKREIFDKTYQKASLEAKIKGFDEKTVNAIELAKIDGLKKQAKHLQEDINKLILSAQIKEETTVGNKTIEAEVKQTQLPLNEEKEPIKDEFLKSLHEKYKNETKPKILKEETRSYSEIPKGEFNHLNYNARHKHEVLAKELETLPDKQMEGIIVERPFVNPKNGKQNSTFQIQLADGKKIGLASTMEREEGLRGHFRTEHINEDIVGFPVGVKLEYLPEGKKVIKIFNAKTGKFISWAKETNTGKNITVNDKQIDQLDHLTTIIEKPIIPPGEGLNQPVNPVKPLPTDNVKQNNEENTSIREQAASGNDSKVAGKTEAKAKRLVTGTKKANRKINHPEKKLALSHEVFSAHGLAIQYFVSGKEVNPESVKKLFKGSQKEVGARISYVRKNAPTIEQIAEQIVAENENLNLDFGDVVNAVEDVVISHNSSTSMARELNSAMSEKGPRFNPIEEVINSESELADQDGNAENFDAGIDILDGLTDEERLKLANEQEAFNNWYEENKDIIIPDSDITGDDGGGDQFQKQKSDKATLDIEDHEATLEVTEHIQKMLPKVNVIYNKLLKNKDGKPLAGKVKGNTIEINPYYAGKDTPIHEAGHVLIDAMGYNNLTIQAAIKQLRSTDLYKETAARYPELSPEMLDKEVLAEAIGREGADIFDTEVAKNKFQTFLDKIFQWLKDKLGLEKNIAKKLAKEILRGDAKDLTGTSTEDQEQKNDFVNFREKTLGRNVTEEANDLDAIEGALQNPTISPEEKQQYQAIKDKILNRINDDKVKYQQHSDNANELHKIVTAEDLSEFTLDDLVRAYNGAKDSEGYIDYTLLEMAKKKIGFYLEQNQIEFLEKAQPLLFNKAEVNKKDLSGLKVWTRALSDIQEKFPAVQALSKIFNDKFLEMQQERSELKAEHERLGKAVIKAHNKKLGIAGKAQSLFSSNAAKYFDYLDNGKGQYISDTKGLNEAQIEYLKFMKKLNKMRGDVFDENENLIEDSVLKTDKGFLENWGEKDGGLKAVSYALGGGNNLDTEVDFTNPKTGKIETVTYKDAQKTIIDHAYSKEGNKGTALGKLLVLAYKAKRSGQKSAYALNYNGALTSKFDQPYKGESYSKDFYRAGMAAIDDLTHVKHIGSLVPLFDSVQYLYKKGYDGRLPNIAKFIEGEMQAKVYQREQSFDPALDNVLKFFRHLVSKTTMAFNVPANVVNAFIGNYNNWREEGLGHIVKGTKRMFGKGGLNKYSLDILKKYEVINIDRDSNPSATSGLLSKIAYIGQQLGEAQIQGSMFLGYLTREEFDSFEYKDGKLVVKEGVDEKSMQAKMNEYKDQISSIQGSYSEKDRRKFMLGEVGKTVAAYKTWMPDWWKSRYGAEMIDKYGNIQRGSWNMITRAARKELAHDFSKENNYGIVIKNGLPTIKNKQLASSLRGAAVVISLLAATYRDDKEKKKKKFEQLSLDNTLGNMLFIWDPEQAEYLVTHPIAIQGPITDFVKSLDAALKGDGKKFKKSATRLIPYRKVAKDVELLTK